jgi:hypothetical protein
MTETLRFPPFFAVTAGHLDETPSLGDAVQVTL